jgi:3-oxoacyl-[acyl-carrier protein] reductase
MTAKARPVALVSGGSRGIGRAVVRRLAADGHDVAFCYQSRQEAAELAAKEARELGANVLARQADVARFDEMTELVRATEDELGPVEVVVTSAGITKDAVLLMMRESDWREVVDVNLTGTFNLCRSAVFAMMKRRSGSIITLSSVSGVYGNPGQTNYSATKAGIIGFTKALAKEVGRYGIRANVVAPGFIETDMTRALAESARAEMLKRIPLGRWGGDDEVADMVSFLASARAAYVTAGVFPVDGGIQL